MCVGVDPGNGVFDGGGDLWERGDICFVELDVFGREDVGWGW